jgi:tetratricopeptide (TPR) repeat protein
MAGTEEREEIRMRSRPFRSGFGVFTLILAAAGIAPVAAQEFRWPERGKNLQVLPKDFPAERLHAVMSGFRRSLGVGCVYCHVGQEGKPLATFDFVSDANPNKERAREMYRMLGDINGHLKKIQPSADKRVNMWCQTCHRGRPRPTTLAEELDAARDKGGAAAAVARYHELKQKFDERGGLDFSENALNDYGYERLEAKDYDGAIAILRLSVDEHPSSGNGWDSLGEAYAAAGKRELSRIAYSKSLELDPGNENAVKKLRELDGAAH